MRWILLFMSGKAQSVRLTAAMPTELQWLRARAIHAFFEGREGVGDNIYQFVFALCDCPPRIFSTDRAFALLTDWGSVVTWGAAKEANE